MRLANDATHLAKLRQDERKRLLLRSQVERKAATYRSVRTQGGGGKGEKSEDTSRSAKRPAVPWNPAFDDFYIALDRSFALDFAFLTHFLYNELIK
jgi:hypothetical protein